MWKLKLWIFICSRYKLCWCWIKVLFSKQFVWWTSCFFSIPFCTFAFCFFLRNSESLVFLPSSTSSPLWFRPTNAQNCRKSCCEEILWVENKDAKRFCAFRWLCGRWEGEDRKFHGHAAERCARWKETLGTELQTLSGRLYSKIWPE